MVTILLRVFPYIHNRTAQKPPHLHNTRANQGVVNGSGFTLRRRQSRFRCPLHGGSETDRPHP
jgi:hypothetical protein